MARKVNVLGTAFKIGKAIDRAHKQSVRDAERRRKQEEREDARRQREHEKMLRQQERDQAAREKAKVAADKERFKKDLGNAKTAYDLRCKKRQELRNKFVDQVLR